MGAEREIGKVKKNSFTGVEPIITEGFCASDLKVILMCNQCFSLCSANYHVTLDKFLITSKTQFPYL